MSDEEYKLNDPVVNSIAEDGLSKEAQKVPQRTPEQIERLKANRATAQEKGRRLQAEADRSQAAMPTSPSESAELSSPANTDRLAALRKSLDGLSEDERYALLKKETVGQALDLLRIKFDRNQVLKEQYTEAPKLQEFVVNELIPRGMTFVFAAAGGTGKGLALLNLACIVAGDGRNGLGNNWLGHPVSTYGPVVYIAAEDNRATIHRRLDAMGLPCRPDNLLIYPLPDMGEIPCLLTQKGEEVQPTPLWSVLKEQIIAYNPVLVIFDPIRPLAAADLDKNNMAAAKVMAAFNSLATRLNAAVILAHHTNKSARKSGTIDQGSISGASAILDEARGAGVLAACGESVEDGFYFKVVKANFYPTDFKQRKFVREGVILVPKEDSKEEVEAKKQKAEAKSLEDKRLAELLAEAIDSLPTEVTISGKKTGIACFKERLPPEFNKMGRDEIQRITKEAIAMGLLEADSKGFLKRCRS